MKISLPTIPLRPLVVALSQPSCSISNAALLKPRPRPYRRRLYEAVLKPMVPLNRLRPSETCSGRDEIQKPFREQLKKLSPVELARIRFNREEFQDAGLFAVCQGFDHDQRTVLIQSGIMTMDKLIVRKYTNRVMKGMVKGTKFQAMDPLFVGNNYVIFAEGIVQLPALVKHTKKFSWLSLLAVSVDDRILTAEEAEKMAAVKSVASLKSETVSLLGSVAAELPGLLMGQLNSLTRNLQLLTESSSEEEEKK